MCLQAISKISQTMCTRTHQNEANAGKVSKGSRFRTDFNEATKKKGSGEFSFIPQVVCEYCRLRNLSQCELLNHSWLKAITGFFFSFYPGVQGQSAGGFFESEIEPDPPPSLAGKLRLAALVPFSSNKACIHCWLSLMRL